MASNAEYINGYYTGNVYLGEGEMTVNAVWIWSYLAYFNWSANAVAGMLGNMEYESNINPGVWQDLNASNPQGGYGLVQWTPSTKYTNWCRQKGYEPKYMDSNLERIIWEQENEGGESDQWIPLEMYNYKTFTDFKFDTLNPGDMAEMFVRCYERPLDISATLDGRRAAAEKWFAVIQGFPPDPPGPTPQPGIAKKSKLLFYMRKRF